MSPLEIVHMVNHEQQYAPLSTTPSPNTHDCDVTRLHALQVKY